tara:strand:+ start:138 stop:359 length:222 start_codon:yes stop_codon:yes gene_type:complete
MKKFYTWSFILLGPSIALGSYAWVTLSIPLAIAALIPPAFGVGFWCAIHKLYKSVTGEEVPDEKLYEILDRII